MREYPQQGNCRHDWQLANIKIDYKKSQSINDGEGLVTYVCAACCSHTFLRTNYVGYNVKPEGKK